MDPTLTFQANVPMIGGNMLENYAFSKLVIVLMVFQSNKAFFIDLIMNQVILKRHCGVASIGKTIQLKLKSF